MKILLEISFVSLFIFLGILITVSIWMTLIPLIKKPKLMQWCLSEKIIEKRFYDRYPTIPKKYVNALKYLSVNKIDLIFLIGPTCQSIRWYNKYDFHPLRLMIEIFRLPFSFVSRLL